MWKCFRNFRIWNLPLGKQGLARLLFHVINAEILKVFRTSAKHQKSYTVLPHHIHIFFNVDTVVITFLRSRIHFDSGSRWGGERASFPPGSPRTQRHLVARTRHRAQEPNCSRPPPPPTSGSSVLPFHPCLFAHILVKLAVTQELTRSIWVPVSSQWEAGETGQRPSPSAR